MICEDIEKQQIQILDNVYSCKPSEPSQSLTGILKTILEFRPDQALYAFGEFGLSLNRFASAIDLESPHPDLFKIYDSELVSEKEGTFSKDAMDVLKLAAFGREWLSEPVLTSLKKCVTKHKSYKALSKVIDSPEENLLHVRFVPLRAAREKIRSRKTRQIVNTEILYKKAVDFWSVESSNFMIHSRGQFLYESDIEEANSRHQHFSNLGLQMMADEISKSIDILKKESKESQYHGFNKITVTTATVILAKLAGFSYKDGKISADTKDFKYRFFADVNNLFDDSHVKPLFLETCAYTYEELKHCASTDIINLMNFLEDFAEIGGHPLFDHYRVLVPGNNFFSYQKKSKNSKYSFRMPDGTLHEETNLADAKLKLDSELIKQKEIPAILLGERDGDCYFISYF